MSDNMNREDNAASIKKECVRRFSNILFGENTIEVDNGDYIKIIGFLGSCASEIFWYRERRFFVSVKILEQEYNFDKEMYYLLRRAQDSSGDLVQKIEGGECRYEVSLKCRINSRKNKKGGQNE